MNNIALKEIAQQLMTRKKGILAADESIASIDKRFSPYGIANNEENRRQFRLLYLASPGIEKHLSGVIMHEETIFQEANKHLTFASLLTGIGVLPGIKVDTGLAPLPGFADETVSLGLDNLAERLHEFSSLGLKFTKWRSAFLIDEKKNLPTDQAILANVHALTRYALQSQEAGLVPIVEPEVLLNGKHSLEKSAEVLGRVLRLLFEHLHYYQVNLSGLILKTSMVLAGNLFTPASKSEQVAKATIEVLKTHVPESVAGVVFLSGGQTPEQAKNNLAAISNLGKQPWPLTFSFARALQEPALDVWQGKLANFNQGQAQFLDTLAANTAVLT